MFPALFVWKNGLTYGGKSETGGEALLTRTGNFAGGNSERVMNQSSGTLGTGWVRLPTKAGERIEGLSKSHAYLLIEAGLIRSACIRRPGCIKGIRLVYLPSIIEYIERHVVEPGAKGGAL